MNLAASDRNGLSARGGIPSRFVLHVNARIRDGDVIQTDRSGSLRYDLVTLRAFVRCWNTQKQAWFSAYLPSLPVAGEDGTLNERMKSRPLARDHSGKDWLGDACTGLVGLHGDAGR